MKNRKKHLLAGGLGMAALLMVVFAVGTKGCEGDDSGPAAPAAPRSPSVLAIRTTQLPKAEVSVPWAVVLKAGAGTEPYVWTVTGRPSWMRLDASTGVLWGMVPGGASGQVTLKVGVTDAAGAADDRSLVLEYKLRHSALPPIVLASTADAIDGHFRTHLVCANCHTNAPGATAMRDNANREIAPVNLWRGTMMANSFRDPYFRAVLAAEIEHHPNLAATIEDTCLSCHAPQAAYEAHQAGAKQTLAELYNAGTARAQIGIDGASCTLCHQMESTGLGTPATFSARYLINPNREIYARHPNPFTTPMVASSGYTPTQADHMKESSMCGSCHTLHTTVLDLNSNPTGEVFPEQAVYLEWRNSVFTTETPSPGPDAQSCQDCHMPPVDQDGLAIATRIARRPQGDDFPPIVPRTSFARHSIIGANTIMLSILRDNAAELNPAATAAEFNHLIDRSRDMLRNQTADVSVQNLSFAGGTLGFGVQVENRVGHKFPTSYPSRRAWLRVQVKDSGGNVVWSSGDYDSAGRILGGDGNPLASEAAFGPIQPHYDLVTGRDQVQIHEGVARDVSGEPNFALLFATGFYKDNRLLPRGWSGTHADIGDTAPAGVDGDTNFTGGRDVVSYRVAGLPQGAYTVVAELLYQTISAREAHEVFVHDHLQEVNVFRRYFENATRTPELIDIATATTP